MEDELLAFPPETTENNTVPPLNDSELITLREMIADYNQKKSFLSKTNTAAEASQSSSNLFQPQESVEVKPVATSLFSDEPPITPVSTGLFFTDEDSNNSKVSESQQSFAELLETCKNYDSSEAVVLNEFKEIIAKLQGVNEKTLITAFLGLFPCKRFIRHGTPEQKLFVLKSLSDRFLENIAGLKFQERKRLLKLVAKYLSEISDNYSFIPMEGEPFKPMFHERVAGSSASGLTVKEMRSFLIVDSSSNHIIYTGLVLS